MWEESIGPFRYVIMAGETSAETWNTEPNGSLLTSRLVTLGRALLALVLRVDIGKLAGIQPSIADADAGQIMQWLTRAVVDLELMVTWLVIWPCLHLGYLLISRFILGQSRGLPQILIPVELFPGLMLALAFVRMALAYSQFTRVARAVGAARKAGVPPPAWTQRPGLLLRLATPTDVDLVLGVLLIAAIEILIR